MSVDQAEPVQTGLDAHAYTDPAFYQREQSDVFHSSWVCVGLTDDVPEIGDIKQVMCGGRSILITRAKDGHVHALHNYCRHRGMRLVSDACAHRKQFICPYHAWVYELDGRLARTPSFGGPGVHAADPAILPGGLERVPVAIWHRLIFINVAGNAGPFELFIKPLADRWARYDFSILRKAESATLEIACNWKLAIENFTDVYHVPFVHPTLSRYNKVTARYYINETNVFGQGNPAMSAPDDAFGKLPMFPGLAEADAGLTEALCLFPNLLVTIFSDHLRVIVVEPTRPGSCREHIAVFVAGDEAMAPALAPHRRTLMERFMSFNSEDIGVVSELQQSMLASNFRDAAFASFWDAAVMSFQGRIMQCMASPDGRGGTVTAP